MQATQQAGKTIGELLREGQGILAENEEAGRRGQEREEAKRRAGWTSLCQQALADLGELARDLTIDPPDDFHAERDWCLELRPFGRAAITTVYRYFNGGWTLKESGSFNRPEFRVDKDFSPDFDDDADMPAWVASANCRVMTNNLAEAVAICERASPAYTACQEECDRRNVQPKLEPKVIPEFKANCMEESLLVALLAMIALGLRDSVDD
jgi:hypothetical protein